MPRVSIIFTSMQEREMQNKPSTCLVSVHELEVNLDGTKETFITNRSYCARVNVCGGENCK